MSNVVPRQDGYLREQLTQFNPLVVLFYSYLELGQFTEADDLLRVMGSTYAAQPGIQQALQQLAMQLNVRRAQSTADTTARQ